MKWQQFSIPMENRRERLSELTAALGDHGIQLAALSLVDSIDFGELRMLVSDVRATRNLLMQRQIPARVDEVVAVAVDDGAAELSRLIALLGANGIRVEYSYACGPQGSAKNIQVFRFNDNDAAIELMAGAGIMMLSPSVSDPGLAVC